MLTTLKERLLTLIQDAPSRTDQKFGQWRHWVRSSPSNRLISNPNIPKVQTGLKPVAIGQLESFAQAISDDQMKISISETSAIPIVNKTKEALTPYVGPGPGAGCVIIFHCF